MKSMILASAVLIAGLAACGGSSGTSALPAATPTVPSAILSSKLPQGGGGPYEPVTFPATGMMPVNGTTFTLAAAVPVYNTGDPIAAPPYNTFASVVNANPAYSTLVGSVTTGESEYVIGTDPSLWHGFYLNGNTTIPCSVDDENNVPGTPGVDYVGAFYCSGNPI